MLTKLKKFFLKHPNVIASPPMLHREAWQSRQNSQRLLNVIPSDPERSRRGVEGSHAHARKQLDHIVSPLHIYWGRDSVEKKRKLMVLSHQSKKWAKRFLVFSVFSVLVFTVIRIYNTGHRPAQAADILIKLDEGSSTSANDTNSTVSAGTITGAAWKPEDLCKFGKCLYFDGTGDYVSYADNANLDMGSGDTVTIEGWFRTTDITSGTRTLISKYETTGADGGYQITMNSSGYLVFGIDNDNSSFPSDSVTSTLAYDDNQWHHFAAVKDAGTSITLYVDGHSVGTPDTSPAADVSNNDTFYIGIDNGSSNGWVGFIDEIKIMRTARTAAQVKTDFLGETPSRGTSASFGGGDLSFLSDGLVGYWRLDESAADSCTGAVNDSCDSSGNNNDAAWNAQVTPAAGKFGNGTTFDGTGDYIDAGDIGL